MSVQAVSEDLSIQLVILIWMQFLTAEGSRSAMISRLGFKEVECFVHSGHVAAR